MRQLFGGLSGKLSRQAPEPAPQWIEDNLEELLDELMENKVLRVPSPYDDGVYTLQLRESIYNTPVCVFWMGASFGTAVHGNHNYRHSWESPDYGPQIAWRPAMGGWLNSRYSFSELDTRGHAKMILLVIRAGRRLNMMTCGKGISSQNREPTPPPSTIGESP